MIHKVSPDELVDRSSTPLSSTPRAFLRWAGSKRSHLEHLVQALPESFNTYFEPFLGGGSLFFLLRPTRAVLADSCSPLIDTYKSVRDGPRAVADWYSTYSVMDEVQYYQVRNEPPPSNRFERAARFLFLNRACWNGLYRVNSKGKFNVPYGKPYSESPLDLDNLVSCSSLLKRPGIAVSAGDFEPTLRLAKEGDLVFLDPPYVTQHNNNGFVDYNQRLFSWADQIRLAKEAERLRLKGVSVIMTNAAHYDILALYPEFNHFQFVRSSTLASNSAKRGRVNEAVIFAKSN